ncbi:MAG: hypothetical protein M3275_15335 [Thermoproteota archaeon]|nr:hypothetical protein [Thermoproteota archaeon]
MVYQSESVYSDWNVRENEWLCAKIVSRIGSRDFNANINVVVLDAYAHYYQGVSMIVVVSY